MKGLRVAVGLFHYPMLNRNGDKVATNITHFDIHDIARACRTYGVERYYLIHPVWEQLMFVERVFDHWRVGEGRNYNSSRKESLKPARTAPNWEKALEDWGLAPQEVLIVGTHARSVEGLATISLTELRAKLLEEKKALFLWFGTGYGFDLEFLRQNCHYHLESIKGCASDGFCHLSVRSAVSIYLDRLFCPC